MTETKTEVSESNESLQHQASSDPSQSEEFETAEPPTEVPYLKNLLEYRVINAPKYTDLYYKAMESYYPGSAHRKSRLEDVQLPFMLENTNQAPIFEAELLRALENVGRGEYLWVYFEEPHRVVQMTRDKPTDASPQDIRWVSCYLTSVQSEILEFAKRSMGDIFDSWIYHDLSELRESLAKYSPGKKNWEPYVYIAEHCHKNLTSGCRTEEFMSKFEVRYFMRLFAEGYHRVVILDFLEEQFEYGSLSMPEEKWPAIVYERFLMKVKARLKMYCMDNGYGPVRHEHTNAHKRPYKKVQANVVCFNCNEKGYYARNCPKQKKRRSD